MQMSERLDDQIALVTGASRGIGQAIALELGRLGATVVGTATSDAGADSISALLQAQDIAGKGMTLDVTQAGAIDTLIKLIEAQFGTVTVLVNNAGVTRDNLLLRMKDSEWDTVIDTDLSALFRLSKAVLRGMVKARWGRIINITSVVAATGNAGQSNYAAAKAGVIGFTKSLAREVGARHITVNAVAPGMIDTDMTRALNEAQRAAIVSDIPLSRLGLTEDVAHAVTFLASHRASYITGETLHVNGGMYMG